MKAIYLYDVDACMDSMDSNVDDDGRERATRERTIASRSRVRRVVRRSVVRVDIYIDIDSNEGVLHRSID